LSGVNGEGKESGEREREGEVSAEERVVWLGCVFSSGTPAAPD